MYRGQLRTNLGSKLTPGILLCDYLLETLTKVKLFLNIHRNKMLWQDRLTGAKLTQESFNVITCILGTLTKIRLFLIILLQLQISLIWSPFPYMIFVFKYSIACFAETKCSDKIDSQEHCTACSTTARPRSWQSSQCCCE